MVLYTLRGWRRTNPLLNGSWISKLALVWHTGSLWFVVVVVDPIRGAFPKTIDANQLATWLVGSWHWVGKWATMVLANRPLVQFGLAVSVCLVFRSGWVGSSFRTSERHRRTGAEGRRSERPGWAGGRAAARGAEWGTTGGHTERQTQHTTEIQD